MPPPSTTPPQMPVWLLRQLLCPFQGNSPGKSEYYCAQTGTPAGCPFGHRTIHSPQASNPPAPTSPDTAAGTSAPSSVLPAPPNTARELKRIPPGVCVDHLLGRCATRDQEEACGSAHLSLEELQQKCNLNVIIPESPSVPPVPEGATPGGSKKKKPKTQKKKKGTTGAPPPPPPVTEATPVETPPVVTPTETPTATPTATPTTQDTTDYPTVTTDGTSTPTSEPTPKIEVANASSKDTPLPYCNTCKAPIPYLAILENCAHAFCGPCMLAYRARCFNIAWVTCTRCGVKSRRVFPWYEAIECDTARHEAAQDFEFACTWNDVSARANEEASFFSSDLLEPLLFLFLTILVFAYYREIIDSFFSMFDIYE